MNKRVALLGEYTQTFQPHIDTETSIEHSRAFLESEIEGSWVSTADIDKGLFKRFSAIWVVPGSPYKNMNNTLWAIRYARENNIPCLGTCGGFQHMVIECARNVLDFTDAEHEEYDPYSSQLLISQLFVGRTRIAPDILCQTPELPEFTVQFRRQNNTTVISA